LKKILLYKLWSDKFNITINMMNIIIYILNIVIFFVIKSVNIKNIIIAI